MNMEHNDDVDHTPEMLPHEDSDATSRHFPVDVDVADHASGSWASGGPVVVARSVDDLSEFCRPGIYKACRCLGMSYRAIHDWLAVHDNPCTMISFFTAAVLGLLGPCVVFTYFHPAVTWKFLVPLGISLSSEMFNILFFWRDGPNHAETRKCHILALLWAIPLIGLSLAAFFRPESSTPFSSQPIFCGVVSAQVFWIAVSCKAGRIPTMRIPKLGSLQGLLMESLGITIRVMDILTSMLLIYSISVEVCGPPWTVPKMSLASTCARAAQHCTSHSERNGDALTLCIRMAAKSAALSHVGAKYWCTVPGQVRLVLAHPG